MNVILRGIVGSHAYGLDTPESGIDTAGIFAVDTKELFGLKSVVETHVTKAPDSAMHEARKFCALALQCNPSILELLWLGRYETNTPLGWQLIVLRNYFLSSHRVKSAYLGYAQQQMGRMKGAASEPADAEPRRSKIAKHARHVARLLYQGYQLYRTGTLPVRLPYPHLIRSIGDWAAQGDYQPLFRYVASHEAKFSANPSVLPEAPDPAPIERWLYKVRMAHLPDGVLRKSRLGDLFTDDLTKPVLADPGAAVE